MRAPEEGRCAPWGCHPSAVIYYVPQLGYCIAVAIAGAEILAGVHLKGLYSTDSTLKLFRDLNRNPKPSSARSLRPEAAEAAVRTLKSELCAAQTG